MRLGRDFTNLLEYEYLTAEQRGLFQEGKLSVADMDATVQIQIKRDISRQVAVAKETGLEHVELDGGIPNPYLSMSAAELKRARQEAEKKDITLSIHLPYTFVAESTCSFQEEDRQTAVAYMKRYLDFAGDLGCLGAVMHIGSIPYYQAGPEYLRIMDEMAAKSLIELGRYAEKKKIVLHMENNTKWDVVHVKPEDSYPLFKKVRAAGVDVKYCFDLAHTFTLCKTSDEIPRSPEEAYEKVPDDLYCGIQIGDYIPEKQLFHPPIHREEGVLKRANWLNAFRILKKKGAKYVVIESAVREKEDMVKGFELQAAEARWMRAIWDEAFKDGHGALKIAK